MNFRLAYFHYYFTMTGKVRNLFSIECQFQPILPDGASEAEVKAGAQELVEVYIDILDRVFRELVRGKREPFLQDSPNQVTVGYQFEGRIRKLPLAILTRRARSVFACQAVRDPRRPLKFLPLEATIDCTYRKQGRHVRSGDITARLQLGHMLNLCFFQFTKGLEGLEGGAGRAREHGQPGADPGGDVRKTGGGILEVDNRVNLRGQCGRGASCCQSALKIDPLSACKIDPSERHDGGCPGSQ